VKDFASHTLQEYIDILGSDAPSPGGGSAASVVAAVGAALGEMVCRINGKKKSNPDFEGSLKRGNQIKAIKDELMVLSTKDAEAFKDVSKVWGESGPKLQEALQHAASVPLQICESCAKVMKIAQKDIPLTSKHLISDLAECGILMRSAFQSARLNVLINLNLLENKEEVSKLSDHLQSIHSQVNDLSQILEQSFEQVTSS